MFDQINPWLIKVLMFLHNLFLILTQNFWTVLCVYIKTI